MGFCRDMANRRQQQPLSPPQVQAISAAVADGVTQALQRAGSSPQSAAGTAFPPSISSFLIGQICVVIKVAKYAAVVRYGLQLRRRKGRLLPSVGHISTKPHALSLPSSRANARTTWQNPSPVIYTYIRVSACAKK